MCGWGVFNLQAVHRAQTFPGRAKEPPSHWPPGSERGCHPVILTPFFLPQRTMLGLCWAKAKGGSRWALDSGERREGAGPGGLAGCGEGFLRVEKAVALLSGPFLGSHGLAWGLFL